MAPVSSEASRGSLGLARGPVSARVVAVPRTVASTAFASPVRVWAAPAAGHASRPATTIGTARQRYEAVRLMGYLPVSIRHRLQGRTRGARRKSGGPRNQAASFPESGLGSRRARRRGSPGARSGEAVAAEREAAVHRDHLAGDVGIGLEQEADRPGHVLRSEEHTSELQSRENLVCRLLLEKKKKNHKYLSDCKKNK